MSDEFRFAINPVVQEGNARRLVDIMAQSFSSGARSEELRIRFEEVTGLKRQSFYDTLAYAKYRQWVVGGGQGVPYQLNSDGSWKLPPISTGEPAGEPLSRDQLEHMVSLRTQQIGELQGEVERLRDWSSSGDTNGVNTALTSLLKIVADNGASARQRIRASAAVLGYKTQDDAAGFVRKYLQSVCESTDIAIDYKIEAGELLRRHEAPRVTPDSVRPAYRDEAPTELPEPLKDLVARRRARQDRREREAIEREMGLPPGGAADIPDPTDYLLRIRQGNCPI